MNSKVTLAARVLFGLIFVIFGLNGFLQFIPLPPPPPAGMNFLGALIQTGYLFPLIKGLEVLCGILVLTGYFVPLALLLMAPIVVNIFLFHTILAPQGAPLAIVVFVLEIVLAWSYRVQFAPVLRAK